MPLLNWRALDLNLLIVFHAVMEERHATRAANRLNMTQPALSHALARLRKALNDDLFVRTSEGMEPTPRALHLAGPVRRMLEELNNVVENAADFIAAESTRTFNVALNNHAALVIAPALAAAVRAEGPGIRLDLRPSGTQDVAASLDRGDIDLAIGTRSAPAERFADMHLFDDVFVALVRRDHPAAHGDMTISFEQLASLDHLVLSSTGERTDFVDTELARHGLTRRVSLRAPLLSTGAILARSNMVAVISEGAAKTFADTNALDLLTLPFTSPKVVIASLWHRRVEDAPAHRWLRSIVRRIARQEVAGNRKKA